MSTTLMLDHPVVAGTIHVHPRVTDAQLHSNAIQAWVHTCEVVYTCTHRTRLAHPNAHPKAHPPTPNQQPLQETNHRPRMDVGAPAATGTHLLRRTPPQGGPVPHRSRCCASPGDVPVAGRHEPHWQRCRTVQRVGCGSGGRGSGGRGVPASTSAC